ncbi:DUF4331 family protein [Citromicrobium bathyomarinum]|uniref:DUF4331 family protein n=1 Tax=Citromicrobium bathyomarinum TaxID=72174 RepID=UPI00315A7C2F
MQHKKSIAAVVAGLTLAIGGAALLPGLGLVAADHLDPPSRTDPSVDSTPDRAADIADLFAWHDADNVYLAMTFAGPQATDQPATYDPDVLYTINVSNDSPRTTADYPIYVRFGPGAGSNEYGVQVTGIPGVSGPIVGSVEKTLTQDGVTVRAGLFDDPFFFDLQGFRDTASTGTLSFDSSRDFFAGQNLTAIVISIPRDRIENGTSPIDVWGTTARFGGQL